MRGTQVTLHLKADAKRVRRPAFRLRGLIRRYSDHIGFPVRMRKEGEASIEYEVVNQAKAPWTLPRTEIKEEEYREFYQYLAHDFTDPLAWSHNRVEGKREYTSLLYIPGRAPFDLCSAMPRGDSAHVRRVFIMDDAGAAAALCTCASSRACSTPPNLPLNASRASCCAGSGNRGHPRRSSPRVLDLLRAWPRTRAEKYATF